MSFMACLLCMLTSQLCHADVINIRVSHMGWVNWYSGRVSPSGRRRRVGRVCARGRRLAGEWWRVRPCPTSDFDAVFTVGFVSSSSTQWYGQNTILTTFIFEQKSNTPLNHQLWYQLLGKFRPGMYWYLPIGGLKHTDTIFYVVRQIRLHPRERVIVLDIEIHGVGGLHLLLLQLLQWQQGCCHYSSLFLSTHTHVFSHNSLCTLFTLLSNNCLFYRQTWWAPPTHLSTWRGQQSLKPSHH